MCASKKTWPNRNTQKTWQKSPKSSAHLQHVETEDDVQHAQRAALKRNGGKTKRGQCGSASNMHSIKIPADVSISAGSDILTAVVRNGDPSTFNAVKIPPQNFCTRRERNTTAAV